MIIGNKSGKGADYRAEQQRWEQQIGNGTS